MLNASFPSPFLNYKQAGAKVEVAGREKLGEKDVIVLVYTPRSASVSSCTSMRRRGSSCGRLGR